MTTEQKKLHTDFNYQNSLESLTAEKRVELVLKEFGENIVITSSFGIQSAVLLHMVTKLKPDIPVIFIDTQYHFDETYDFVTDLSEKLNLNLQTYKAQQSAQSQELQFGKRWKTEGDALESYKLQNKVEPMNRALIGLKASAVFSGARRQQSSTRSGLPIISTESKIAKIYPLADWTNKDIHYYLKENNLPYHPLWEKNYVSIGDKHSTVPLGEGMSEEDTRLNGRECGLHDSSAVRRPMDYQI